MALFIIDVIVLIYIGYSAFSGFKAGFLLSLLTLAGIACSYIGAYLLGPAVGSVISDQFSSSKLLGMVIGSMIVFFAIALTVNAIKNGVRFKNKKKVRQRQKDTDNGKKNVKKKGLAIISKISGAIIKTTIAVIMASVALWGYALLRVSPMKDLVPPITGSVSANVSRWVIAQGSYTIISGLVPDKAQALQIANLISRPEASLNKVNNIVKSPVMREMFADESFREDLLSGDRDKILANEKFAAFMNDETWMEEVRTLDVSGDVGSEEYKKQFAQKMATMGAKVKIFIDDPEVKKNIESLKADGLLESENIQKLLSDRRFMDLADKFITK